MSNIGEYIKFGVLKTRALQDHEAESTSIGQFELEVKIGRAFFLASGDKLGLFKSTVAQHLASAIQDTQVPSDYWYFETEKLIHNALNVPSRFSFNPTVMK